MNVLGAAASGPGRHPFVQTTRIWPKLALDSGRFGGAGWASALPEGPGRGCLPVRARGHGRLEFLHAGRGFGYTLLPPAPTMHSASDAFNTRLDLADEKPSRRRFDAGPPAQVHGARRKPHSAAKSRPSRQGLNSQAPMSGPIPCGTWTPRTSMADLILFSATSRAALPTVGQ